MPVSDLDVSSIVARTARSYDALPYASDPFPRTHPSALAAIAHLFALETAPPGEARILELGCAAGGNIIPLAARHPAATIVGIDLSAAQVAAGRARIADLGLTNIELRCQDFAEFSSGAQAPFDYIICHGVYSWVPAPLREQILRICRQNLSPRGVALISYNVLPGWRMLQALRDCFVMQASPDQDPRQRVAAARALLEILPRACPEEGAYKSFLTAEAARLLASSDDYLAHEFLDDVNEPCSFRDFIEAAQRNGLGFLAEAELPSMILANYPPNMNEAVRAAGGNQMLATEQYIDMASGRTFRHTLLLAAARVAQIDRRLASARLESLHFIGNADLALTHDAGGVTLAGPTGRRLHTGSAPLADALARFIAAFPGSSSIDDLVQALPASARNADGRALVREALFNMVLNGLAVARMETVPAVARAGALPVVCPMVRAEAARGDAAIVNLRHERVELDALPRFVLPLLDGSRDASTIAAAVADAAREGRLDLNRGPIESGDGNVVKIAIDNLKSLLPALARAALLLR